MPLPTSLKIGYKTFSVSSWKTQDARAANSVGICDTLNNVILLDVERVATDVVQTLIHEILHAVWFVGDVQDSDQEERVVSILSAQLAQVLADNAGLRDYLTEVYDPELIK